MMKTLITLMMLSLSTLPVLAQENTHPIPKEVNDAFVLLYADAQDVKWKSANTTYEVDFLYDGKMQTIVYDRTGAILALKTIVDITQVPESIATTIRREHRNDVIDEIERVEIEEQVYYYVSFNNDEESVAYSFEGTE